MTGPLDGRVALVAGATRGAGRGIAVALGEAGATVYCSGRSTRERRSEYDRPETIEETAELVTAAGGAGIAVAVDHLEPEQVEALVKRIDALRRERRTRSSLPTGDTPARARHTPFRGSRFASPSRSG